MKIIAEYLVNFIILNLSYKREVFFYGIYILQRRNKKEEGCQY